MTENTEKVGKNAGDNASWNAGNSCPFIREKEAGNDECAVDSIRKNMKDIETLNMYRTSEKGYQPEEIMQSIYAKEVVICPYSDAVEQ